MDGRESKLGIGITQYWFHKSDIILYNLPQRVEYL